MLTNLLHNVQREYSHCALIIDLYNRSVARSIGRIPLVFLSRFSFALLLFFVIRGPIYKKSELLYKEEYTLIIVS